MVTGTGRQEGMIVSAEQAGAQEPRRRIDTSVAHAARIYNYWLGCSAYRWFTGDPEANVDYKRKQQRDLERLMRGDFGYRAS
jgi:hypothetical protein